MKKITLAALVLVLIVMTWLNVSQYVATEQLKTQILGNELISLTNEYRQQKSLGTLKVNDELTKAAQSKADHMAKNSYFGHTSPDGRRFTSWIINADYDYLYAGENLAVLFNSSESVFNAWLKSEKHRQNIAKSRFQEIGIGIAEGIYKGKKAIFVVQMLGTSKLPQ